MYYTGGGRILKMHCDEAGRLLEIGIEEIGSHLGGQQVFSPGSLCI